MQPYPPFSLISGFCSYARKNRYTTSSIPDITVNDLWFATLGGNYLWLVYLQLNSCHARQSGRRLTIGSPADLPQNRAYRSGTRLLPCLRTNRFVIRTERPESRLLKPCV